MSFSVPGFPANSCCCCCCKCCCCNQEMITVYKCPGCGQTVTSNQLHSCNVTITFTQDKGE